MPHTEAVLAPATRWRHGDRDDEARQGHNEESTRWRRELTRAWFDEDAVATLLAALREIGDLPTAAERAGVTPAQVWGRMRWDHDVAARVEQVLAELCGGEHCGTPRGWREGGRCADCRAARAIDRGPKSPRSPQPGRHNPSPRSTSTSATSGSSGSSSGSSPEVPLAPPSRSASPVAAGDRGQSGAAQRGQRSGAGR